MSDKAETPKEAAKAEETKVAAPGGGGIKGFIPLIVAIVLMPVVAVITTQFVIIPKVVKAQEATQAEAEGGEEHGGDAHAAKKDDGHGAKKDDAHAAKKDDAHGAKKDDGHGKDAKGPGGGKGGKKQSFQIAKLIVNVSGTAGTRYLMTSATLVGTKPDFKDLLEENKDQLLDLTIGSLSAKTIADLEKPGSRNLIRSELISVYNNALGANLVHEIYFTEFAIQ